MINEAGFNHVRINLHPFKHMGEAPEYPIDPAWLRTLDWAVEQTLGQGLLAILDMHEFNAMAKDPEGLKPKYLAVWEQLAARYSDAPSTVLFELLNEPNGMLTPACGTSSLLSPTTSSAARIRDGR